MIKCKFCGIRDITRSVSLEITANNRNIRESGARSQASSHRSCCDDESCAKRAIQEVYADSQNQENQFLVPFREILRP